MEDHYYRIVEIGLQGLLIPIILAAWFDLKKAIGINIKQDAQIESMQKEIDEVKGTVKDHTRVLFKMSSKEK